MKREDNILVIIPARGGSKGIPRKNIKLLNGKPLIYYTVEAARGIFKDSQICVSTDDKEIVDLVENIGLKIPFIRPVELASDTATTHDVLLHALNFYKESGISVDTILLLQPTSPLRTSTHIRDALSIYNSKECDMVVSVKETKSNPYFVLYEENEQGILVKSKKGGYQRRQDAPKVWEYNGAIYVINVESLLKNTIDKFERIYKFVMEEQCSIDIDTDLDWKICEFLIQKFNI